MADIQDAAAGPHDFQPENRSLWNWISKRLDQDSEFESLLLLR